MSKDTQPAFPVIGQDGFVFERGMTLRQYFAGQALVGMLANPNDDSDVEGTACDAVLYADALIEELEK